MALGISKTARLAALGFVGAIAAGVAVAVPAAIAVRHRRHEAGIFERRVASGKVRVMPVAGDDGEPVRVLQMDGTYQSATYMDDRYAELVFAYTKLYDLAFEALPSPRRLLMIGGGGYSWPKHFLASRPDDGARLDVVEVDPQITSIARELFYLDRTIEEFDPDGARLRLVCDDGRAYLERLADRLAMGDEREYPYDVICNDSFSGSGEPVATLTSVEAAWVTRACLTEDGVYLSNVVSSRTGEHAEPLRRVAAALAPAFSHLWVVPCSKDAQACDNNMVIATNSAHHRFSGAEPLAVDTSLPIPHDFEAKQPESPLRRIIGR